MIGQLDWLIGHLIVKQRNHSHHYRRMTHTTNLSLASLNLFPGQLSQSYSSVATINLGHLLLRTLLDRYHGLCSNLSPVLLLNTSLTPNNNYKN